MSVCCTRKTSEKVPLPSFFSLCNCGRENISFVDRKYSLSDLRSTFSLDLLRGEGYFGSQKKSLAVGRSGEDCPDGPSENSDALRSISNSWPPPARCCCCWRFFDSACKIFSKELPRCLSKSRQTLAATKRIFKTTYGVEVVSAEHQAHAVALSSDRGAPSLVGKKRHLAFSRSKRTKIKRDLLIQDHSRKWLPKNAPPVNVATWMWFTCTATSPDAIK